MWHVLKTQAFAARYLGEIARRDMVLIGNLPTSLIPLSCHAFRRRTPVLRTAAAILEADDTARALAMHARVACARAAPDGRLPSADRRTLPYAA